MTKVLKLAVRGTFCALLFVSALLATALGNTFGAAPRVGVLGPNEAGSLFGEQCAPGVGGSGGDCKSSLKDYCTSAPTQGVTCTTNMTCSLDGSLCKQLMAASTPTYGCDSSSDDQDCSSTCGGACYTYKSGFPLPDFGCTPPGVMLCNSSGQCGTPVCSITLTSTPAGAGGTP